MKKSKIISLVLITASLASCHHKHRYVHQQPAYLRGDSTANFSRMYYDPFHQYNLFRWYYAFRPYGVYNNGSYRKVGYYSGGISEASNIGHSSTKSSIVRGGFGSNGHSFGVSS